MLRRCGELTALRPSPTSPTSSQWTTIVRLSISTCILSMRRRSRPHSASFRAAGKSSGGKWTCKVSNANVSCILYLYRIIGLYTTLVLVASKFVRSFFAGISFLIMFDDMPNVDRVFQVRTKVEAQKKIPDSI